MAKSVQRLVTSSDPGMIRSFHIFVLFRPGGSPSFVSSGYRLFLPRVKRTDSEVTTELRLVPRPTKRESIHPSAICLHDVVRS
jgi:hypothetical protein